ncbi:MAG: FAD-binding protein [Thermodesulfovibrionales bacterium]|nr:FAD-binding protein [Thermodesulfovibrionales bacterium]
MLKQSVLRKFKEIVGELNCWHKLEDLISYSYDAAVEEPKIPDVVIRPNNYEQICEVIKICSEEGIPLITRGAGTNLSGGTIPVRGGCVLLMTALNKILEINREDLYAVAQAGAITFNLAQEAEKNGLFYPPDPGSMKYSTLGGNVAENAGGLRGLKYGVTKDYLMGVKFFDMEGNFVTGGGKTVKLATGFNIPGLMVSSEGVLGVMFEFIFKLLPKPHTSKSMLVIYKDIIKASETVSNIIASKILPATLELLDAFTIRTVEEATKIGLPTDADALLLIEVDGHPAVVEEDFNKIKEICIRLDGTVEVADNAQQKDKIWEARRKALSCLARIKPTVILEDATVPRSKLSDMMKAIRSISAKYNLTIGTFGHAGDGNLHPTILTDRRDKDEMERVKKAIDDIFEAALKLDGTLSGEHGIGIAKSKYLEKEVGKGTILFMKKLKYGLDPKNLLNPYKMGI